MFLKVMLISLDLFLFSVFLEHVVFSQLPIWGMVVYIAMTTRTAMWAQQPSQLVLGTKQSQQK